MPELVALLFLGVFVALCIGLLRIVAQSEAFRPPARHHSLPRVPVQLPRAARQVLQQTGRPGAITVTPQACPLWQQRGWRQEGKRLRGAYRTRWGSCSGEITLDRRGYARDYFIFITAGPAERLLTSAHGPCFRSRGNGKFWVHFNSHSGDIDSGIAAVEILLNKALNA